MKKRKADKNPVVNAPPVRDSEEPVLTPDDVENRYKIPKSTQAKGRMRGDFCAYIKRGTRVYYWKTDMEAYLTSLRRRHTSDPGSKAKAAA